MKRKLNPTTKINTNSSTLQSRTKVPHKLCCSNGVEVRTHKVVQQYKRPEPVPDPSGQIGLIKPGYPWIHKSTNEKDSREREKGKVCYAHREWNEEQRGWVVAVDLTQRLTGIFGWCWSWRLEDGRTKLWPEMTGVLMELTASK